MSDPSFRGTRSLTGRAVLLATASIALCGLPKLQAQTPSESIAVERSTTVLPTAPSFREPVPVLPQQAGISSASTLLAGTVADPEGALIPGAVVVLKSSNSARDTARYQTATTDSAGHFRFPHVPPGTYRISAGATGFEPFTSAEIAVRPGEGPASLALTLALPPDRADITVTASRHDLAADEIHGLEQQRVLGLFPDFYTSFVPNPVPLDAGQKFSLAFRATTDRMAFVTAGLVAGGEQIQNTFPEWGTGRLGYARRYGAAYTDALTGKILGAAVFPAVFRQDPRYFYMGTGTVKARARHAVLSAFLARGDNGRWQPNYSHILGNAAAGALSTTYHPAADSAGKLALSNALFGTLGEAGVNLTREFVLRRFIHGIQAAANAP